MSGKIKVGGLVLAAALAVLGAWFAFGQGAPGDPCGGHYVGDALKAVFLSQYYDLAVDKGDPYYPGPRPWDSAVQNDVAGLPYQYQRRGGDCVFLFRAGHVIVNVDRPMLPGGTDDERYVKIWLVRNSASVCASPPDFMDGREVHTTAFQFRTGCGYTASRGYQNDPNVLFLTDTLARLNFGAMTPEQTYYCFYLASFRVGNDPDTYSFSGPCKVYYGLLDSGAIGWEITPVHEPFWIQSVTKEGKKIVPKGNPFFVEQIVTLSLVSPTCPNFPGWGDFYFTFKLVLERL